MRIIRANPPGFTKVPNTAIRDPRLSWRARGLHAFLLSHVDEGWPSDAKFLADQGPDGRDACQKGLNELAKYGYVKRVKRRTAKGHWVTEVIVYDVPEAAELTDGGEFPQVAPEPENQDSETQESGNQESAVRESEDQGSSKKTTEETNQKTNEQTMQETIGPSSGRPPEIVGRRAQDAAAGRWLRARYGGLTDPEVSAIVGEVRRRAAEPIRHLVPYLDGMTEGDLADVVGAVMDAADQAFPAVAEGGDGERQPPARPALRPVLEWCRRCDHPDTRLVELEDGRVQRCPTCHPSRAREAS